MPSVLLGSRQSLCVRWLWREWLSHKATCLAGNGIMSSFCPTQEGLFCTFWTRTLMLSPNCLLPRNVTLDRPRGWNAFSRTNDARKRRISSFLYCFVFCWDSLSFSLLYPLIFFPSSDPSPPSVPWLPRVSLCVPRLVLNTWSSCWSLSSTGITGACCHSQLIQLSECSWCSIPNQCILIYSNPAPYTEQHSFHRFGHQVDSDCLYSSLRFSNKEVWWVYL